LRQISTGPGAGEDDYQDLAVSPDGTRVAYRESGLQAFFRIHVLDLRTGTDRVLPGPTRTTAQTSPKFSPDGRAIVYLRFDTDHTLQLVVAPADGSGTGIALGPHGSLGPDGSTINNYDFTPDGTAVIANDDTAKVVRKLPVDGSPGSVLSHGALAFATYQRLAP
jgi:dipeptidyl aminopeptidase/acylaminoacyl peptidase